MRRIPEIGNDAATARWAHTRKTHQPGLYIPNTDMQRGAVHSMLPHTNPKLQNRFIKPSWKMPVGEIRELEKSISMHIAWLRFFVVFCVFNCICSSSCIMLGAWWCVVFSCECVYQARRVHSETMQRRDDTMIKAQYLQIRNATRKQAQKRTFRVCMSHSKINRCEVRCDCAISVNISPAKRVLCCVVSCPSDNAGLHGGARRCCQKVWYHALHILRVIGEQAPYALYLSFASSSVHAAGDRHTANNTEFYQRWFCVQAEAQYASARNAHLCITCATEEIWLADMQNLAMLSGGHSSVWFDAV